MTFQLSGFISLHVQVHWFSCAVFPFHLANLPTRQTKTLTQMINSFDRPRARNIFTLKCTWRSFKSIESIQLTNTIGFIMLVTSGIDLWHSEPNLQSRVLDKLSHGIDFSELYFFSHVSMCNCNMPQRTLEQRANATKLISIQLRGTIQRNWILRKNIYFLNHKVLAYRKTNIADVNLW